MKILKKEKTKSNTFYHINYENQFSLIMLQLNNINRLQNLPFNRRKALFEIIEIVSPGIAILFGSTAKGNFKEKSDIDLLLYYYRGPSKKEEKIIEGDIKQVSSRFGININAIILKKLDLRNESIRHIFKTGIPLIGYTKFYKIFNQEIFGRY